MSLYILNVTYSTFWLRYFSQYTNVVAAMVEIERMNKAHLGFSPLGQRFTSQSH